MVTKRETYCVQFFMAILLALVAAACGGGASGTSGLLSPHGSGELSTSYVLSIMEQGGKTTACELSFAKFSEPIPGEDAVTVKPHPLDTENMYWYAIDVEVGGDGIATYTIAGTPPGWIGT